MEPTSPDDRPTARALLHEAEAHLERARTALDASPREEGAALEATLDVFRASLLAFLTEHGAAPTPDASLDVLAEWAVRCNSVLKTAVRRALHLAHRAPAIRRAARPSVHDREDVETGWYTARNLYETVAARLAVAPSASAA